ncbi:MAG: DNA-directed RNA polymerase subunit B'', partial [Methanothrix sp.]
MSATHEVMESYLKTTSISQQQIDSYNRFITTGLNKIVEAQSLIEPDVSNFAIKLGSIRLEQPIIIESDSSTKRILPNEALARNLTYAAPMYLTYVPVISGIEKADAMGEAYVGELPVMVKSNLCYTKNMTEQQLVKEGEDPDDPGGYFIIKGTERVLVGIEDLAPNRMITTKEKVGIVVKVFSTTVNFRARCSITRDDYGMYTVLFPTLNKGISLSLILRSLGMDQKSVLALTEDNFARNDLMLNMEVGKNYMEMQPKDAIIELGRITAPNQAMAYQEKRAETQLDTYILPHLGTSPEVRKEKAAYLIRMASRTSMVANGTVKPDDKDHYANKRVKLAGDLLEELFNTAFKAFIKDIKYHVERTTARGRR